MASRQSMTAGGEVPEAAEAKIQNAVDSWFGGAESTSPDRGGKKSSKKRKFEDGKKEKVKEKEKKKEKKKEKDKEKEKQKDKKSRLGRSTDRLDKKECSEETRLFGIPLMEAAWRTDKEEGLIPSPLRRAVEYLNDVAKEEEGLYRVPGAHSKYLEYKAIFDSGEEVDFFKVEKVHQNVAMMVMKYIKELPEPLFTDALSGRVKKVLYGVKDPKKQNQLLRKTMGMLPLVNREVFRYLINHLRILAKHRTVEQQNATLLSWGISLGRMLGRLVEVLFEGSDDLIPQTRTLGVEFSEAARRSHKRGLVPAPIRFSTEAFTKFQEDRDNFFDNLKKESSEQSQKELSYLLDGTPSANPLLEYPPCETVASLRRFINHIPGTIFTEELNGEFMALCGDAESIPPIDAVRDLIIRLPRPNMESLKVITYYFAQLGTDEFFAPEKIRETIKLLFGTHAPLFISMTESYSELWSFIADQNAEREEPPPATEPEESLMENPQSEVDLPKDDICLDEKMGRSDEEEEEQENEEQENEEEEEENEPSQNQPPASVFLAPLPPPLIK